MTDASLAEPNAIGRPRYLGVVVIAAIALLILFSFGGASVLAPRHRLTLVAHFQNVQGLRSGGFVRLAGVEIGTVKAVTVRPELRDKPAEVMMSIHTDHDLKIPSDSIALLSTAGVLGETFVDVDIRSATGPAIKNGGELQTREVPQMSTSEMMERFGAALKPKPCQPGDDQKTSDTTVKK